MAFKSLLNQKKPTILKKWFERVMDTYPAESSKFLKAKSNHFANPVGSTITSELKVLLDGLIMGADQEQLSVSLDRIVRIRAVQDFTASEAIQFIFLLKDVLREEIEVEAGGKSMTEDLRNLHAAIDSLALMGFDIYMDCCRQLYEIRVAEAKNRMYMSLRRANMVE